MKSRKRQSPSRSLDQRDCQTSLVRWLALGALALQACGGGESANSNTEVAKAQGDAAESSAAGASDGSDDPETAEDNSPSGNSTDGDGSSGADDGTTTGDTVKREPLPTAEQNEAASAPAAAEDDSLDAEAAGPAELADGEPVDEVAVDTGGTDPVATPSAVEEPAEGAISIEVDLPKDTPLSELDDEQWQELCDALDASLTTADAAKVQCELVGALLGVLSSSNDDEFSAACAASRDECLASANTSTTECNPEAVTPECEATIGDYETCVNTSFAQVPDLNCDSGLALATLVLLASAGTTDTGLASTPECERVNACSPPDEQAVPLSDSALPP